jgi:RNA polymerase sigma-70 factor (ECF subfamily)
MFSGLHRFFLLLATRPQLRQINRGFDMRSRYADGSFLRILFPTNLHRLFAIFISYKYYIYYSILAGFFIYCKMLNAFAHVIVQRSRKFDRFNSSCYKQNKDGTPEDQNVNQVRLEDEELIRRISGGDLSAFEELVARYKALIYNTCYRLLRDYHGAEDATQNVFLQVYKSAEFFRGESRVSTWMYRIAVNRSLNIIRKNKRFRLIKSLGSPWTGKPREDLPVAAPEQEPDRIFEDKESKLLLRDAIDSLPEKQRVAFILHKHENLTSKEIADILGVSINSVEVRIHRAKLTLQKRLVERLKKYP